MAACRSGLISLLVLDFISNLFLVRLLTRYRFEHLKRYSVPMHAYISVLSSTYLLHHPVSQSFLVVLLQET